MRRSFTLIELLVVVGVIALLMAIALPALSAARKRAQQMECGSNLKQIMQVTAVYADESNFYLPFPNSESLESPPGSPGDPYWPGAGWLYSWPAVQAATRDRTSYLADDRQEGILWRYLESEKVYLCPSAPRRTSPGNADVMTSYMMNAVVRGQAVQRQDRVAPSIRIDRFPATGVIYWEPMGNDETDSTGRSYSPNWNDGAIEPTNGPTFRHLKGVNAAFFDNHVEFWSIDTFVEEESSSTFSKLWCDPRFPDTGRAP